MKAKVHIKKTSKKIQKSKRMKNFLLLLEDRGRAIRHSADFSLSLREKEIIREKLHSEISSSRAEKEAALRRREKSRVSIFESFVKRIITFFHMATAAALAALLGGGVSFAAESSLPGDALYPIKTQVNEEVSGFLALSDQAKAELQAKLAARRLEEAAELARLGRLTPENRAEVAEKFRAHMEKSEDIALKAEESEDLSSAVGIRSSLESSISAHIKVLEKIDAQTPEGREEINAVLGAVRERLENIADARANAEIKIGKDSGNIAQITKDARASVAEKIAGTKKDFEEALKEIPEKFSAEAQAEIKTQIALAEKSFAEAEIHFGVSAYSNAFALYQQALRVAQEARFFILAKEEFGINDTEANGEISSGIAGEDTDQSATTTTTATTTEKETQETASSTTVRQTTEANINTQNASTTLRVKVEAVL